MKNIKIGIICHSNSESMQAACKDEGVDFVLIDMTDPSWMQYCTNDISGYLIRPPSVYQEHKSIYDERIYYLNKVLGKPIYPSFDELYVYENKRNMHIFLSGFNLPHAKTKVYIDKKTAIEDIENHKFPVMVKSNIGAGGTSVSTVKNKKKLRKIINSTFGLFHPDLSLGWYTNKKVGIFSIPRLARSQRHYLLVQERLDIKWEWRMIRIGDIYMGHKKLIGENGYASGSELVGWDEPPKELLHLLYESTEKMNMRCMVLDVFETDSGEFYINEMQSIIGAYRPYQMKVNNEPGVYIRNKDNDFDFKPGIYCKNQCWTPRVKDFLSQLRNK